MNAEIAENLVVLKSASGYRAMTQFTHEVIEEADNAHTVLQAAANMMADTGGQVLLSRGVFALDKALLLGDNVELCGCGRGTKLICTSPSDEAVLNCRSTKGVVIRDLAVIGAKRPADGAVGTGVLLDGAGDCRIIDVFCAGFEQHGIWVRNSSFLCEIRGCSLAGNGVANLFLDGLERGSYGDYIPNLVTNCTIYGGGKGIDCNRTIVLNIVACVVYQTNDVAYHVRNTSNSVLISGCRSFQITGNAVVAENSHEFNLSSNIFCWATGHGVVIDDCFWGTICGNEIIDVGSLNPGGDNFKFAAKNLGQHEPFRGIDLRHVRGYNISGNTIFNWSVCPPMEYGIYEDNASYQNTITGNNVNYYTRSDIVSQGYGSIVANNIGRAERPFNDETNEPNVIQTFRQELTEALIAEQMALE